MREKILVVDDEQEIADLVALYLQGESFEVFFILFCRGSAGMYPQGIPGYGNTGCNDA